MKLIEVFEGLSKDDTHLAGGKGASLGEMTQAGIPVPPGFVVLTEAFNRFLEERELREEIEAQLDKVNHHELESVERASEHIRGIIMSSEMPEDISQEILSSFKTLDAEFVAVRSSATAEDGMNASWAGELESFLNTTSETLLENVRRCWASLFTPRAIFYRFEQGFGSGVSVAVVVQKMVQSEVSGIAFSVHPVTEDPNQLIIEAGWGLGEAIVSGSVTPDNYVLDKRDFSLVDSYISNQERALYRMSGGGIEWKPVPLDRQEVQKLPSEKVVELSKLVVRIEGHYGFPCDIEWGMENGVLYIVQSRPITTLTTGIAEIGEAEVAQESKKKDKKNELDHTAYFTTGRWVCPVLEYETWLDWTNTPEAKALGYEADSRSILGIDGHFYVPKHGVYDTIKQKVLEEFRSGSVASAQHIMSISSELSNLCNLQAAEKEENRTPEGFEKGIDLLKRLAFPRMACFAIGEAAEEFLREYSRKNNLNGEEFLSSIPQPANSVSKDQKVLVDFREQIEKEKLPYSIEAIREANNDLAIRLEKYAGETEFMGTHHFWGYPRTIESLLELIRTATYEKSTDITPTEYDELQSILEVIGEAAKWRLEGAYFSDKLAYAYRPFLQGLPISLATMAACEVIPP